MVCVLLSVDDDSAAAGLISVIFFVFVCTIVLLRLDNLKMDNEDSGYKFGKSYDNMQNQQEAYKRKLNARNALGGLIGIIMKADGFCSKRELNVAKDFLNQYYQPFEVRTALSFIKETIDKDDFMDDLPTFITWARQEFSLKDREIIADLLFRIAAVLGIDDYKWLLLERIMRSLYLSDSEIRRLQYSFYANRCTRSASDDGDDSKSYSYSGEKGNYNSDSADSYQSGDIYSQYYAVLELNPSATKAEVKAAYRRLAMQWHPDRVQDEAKKAEYSVKFHSINQAYSRLMNKI